MYYKCRFHWIYRYTSFTSNEVECIFFLSELVREYSLRTRICIECNLEKNQCRNWIESKYRSKAFALFHWWLRLLLFVSEHRMDRECRRVSMVLLVVYLFASMVPSLEMMDSSLHESLFLIYSAISSVLDAFFFLFFTKYLKKKSDLSPYFGMIFFIFPFAHWLL